MVIIGWFLGGFEVGGDASAEARSKKQEARSKKKEERMTEQRNTEEFKRFRE